MKRALGLGRKFSTAVKYNAHGHALTQLKRETVASLPSLGSNEVALKILAAPINPSDINMVEGVYGKLKPLPAIAGNEGVAVVKQVGSGVTSLKEGDWVVPAVAGFGTWREEAVALASELIQIPNDIPKAYAASLSVNPATAYRLLRDFATLSPGDVVVQNGANSMVGQAVVQLAREMGLRTVNVVRRDRPSAETTLRLLNNLGGDVNVTDEYFNSYECNEILADLPPVKLALNCVGGPSATDLLRVLAPGGTLVSYGAMSKQPLTLPLDLLVDRQLSAKGFWITAWNEAAPMSERQAMLHELARLVKEDKLTFFYEMHDFDDFEYALKKSQESFRLRKVVLDMDYPDRLAQHDEKLKDEDEWYRHFRYPVH